MSGLKEVFAKICIKVKHRKKKIFNRPKDCVRRKKICFIMKKV